MNSSFIRWLFDVEVIPADAGDVQLAFERPLAGWVWLLCIVAAIAFAFWSYSRLSGARWARFTLASLRVFMIALVLLVISGPMLMQARETIEPDWLLVLADRSASMTIADAEGADGRVPRDEQLSNLLREHEPVLSALADERHVEWLGFHQGAFPLADRTDLGDASGARTRLNTAVGQALQRAAARPVSGVVLLTDGRTNDPPTRELLRRLQSDQVRVFPVALGSRDPIGDLAIRRIDAPGRAFVRDKVPVVVHLDRLGGSDQASGAVKLVDIETGEVLDEKPLPEAAQEQLTLVGEPALAGEATWQVVIETDRPDLIPDNNLKPFAIELIDRPLRVLYVDGYPRWEYHYVKELIVQEKSIESSVFLISADRDFAQEGNQPITRLPRSPEEFADFDVIIIGDVPGTFFSPEQIEMIREQVAVRGAGLLWMGGERYTPATYTGAAAALADLMPMQRAPAMPRIDDPVTMQPTPLADRLGVLRLATDDRVGWPIELSDPDYGWCRLQYAQRIEPGRLKPTAEVLAETVQTFGGVHLPLVINMRYGSGQTLYVATDEIWRWRYGRGEMLPEQFWVQMIRMLGRESVFTSADRAVLEAKPRRVEIGQPVRIDLRLLDARLADQLSSTVTALVETEQGEAVADIDLLPIESSRGQFGATVLPDTIGVLHVRVDDVRLDGLDLEATFEVYAADDELRRPETDHELLEDLAAATGGVVLDDETLPALMDPEVLPNRSVRTLNPLTERIWDAPIVFILALLVLSAEWIGRKVLRLI